MEKFLHIHLLISIVFSTLFVLVLGNKKSFLSLNSTEIMEARKRFMSFDMTKLPNPPMPSYTFAIYNRDLFEKSKFEDYESLLKNKFARSQARANHLASVLRNGNAIGANGTLTSRPAGTHESKRDREGVLKTTDLFYIAGEHVGSFSLGSKRVTSFLLVDTGSDLVWWQCAPCEEHGCYEQKHDPLYDSTDSRTYRKLDCIAESARCLAPNPGYLCHTDDHTCYYDLSYVDGARIRGWIAEDVITFVVDQSRAKILFGCGKDQMSGTLFSGEYSGIAGLSRRITTGVGYSLSSQFQSDIMAICLPGMYSTQAGSLTFHTTPFNRETSAQLVPNSYHTNYYFVNLYNVYINDKEVPFDPSFWHFRNDMSGGCIVDTGTLFTYLPRTYYTVFRDIYRQEAQNFQRYDAPGAIFDTCYMADPTQEPNFPIVTMYFGGPNLENALYLGQQRVLTHLGETYCLAFVPWDQQSAVLGAYQLQGIGLTFHTGANTLSFDLDGCH